MPKPKPNPNPKPKPQQKPKSSSLARPSYAFSVDCVPVLQHAVHVRLGVERDEAKVAARARDAASADQVAFAAPRRKVVLQVLLGRVP
jgi:hypothetical protein